MSTGLTAQLNAIHSGLVACEETLDEIELTLMLELRAGVPGYVNEPLTDETLAANSVAMVQDLLARLERLEERVRV